MNTTGDSREGAEVLDVFIDALTWNVALSRIAAWARERESRYVCNCNVHSLIEASQDASFRNVLNQADMATPDGMPLAWMLRHLGFARQQRIAGPDLMWKYCERAEESGDSIYLFGSTVKTLSLLSEHLLAAFPALRISGLYSPPFYPPSEEEDAKIVASMNGSGAGVVFVGLGCPKQEKWMAAHRGRVKAVMIGVGAAFDYHAVNVKRAPRWMQRNGLEWLYRLRSEPRRLWKRYLVTNAIFIYRIIRQVLPGRKRHPEKQG
jgi:N-acetylglucosaminyldiphosphoundecaprenol N-acetyl-beta-D-mannosaminyltransferase